MTVLQNDIKSVNPKLIKRLNDFKNTCINNNITLMNEMGFTVSDYVINYKNALKTAVKKNLASLKNITLFTSPKKYANEDPNVLTDGALGGNSFY